MKGFRLAATAMTSRRSRNLTAFIALLPIVGVWIWKVAVRPRPFWIHYYDPETIYFYEGLRILRGEPPFNVDNPGTPVQLVSAAIALFTGTSPLTYPAFIAVAHAVGLLVTIGGAFLLVHTLLRDAPPAIAMAAIWTWFIAPQALEYQLVWSPEVFYFGFGALALVAIARSLQHPSVRADLIAGAAVGLLISIKFVFVAWLAAICAAYLVPRGGTIAASLRRAAVATGGAILAFAAATAVAWPRYPAMVAWLMKLALHSGTYGSGQRELPRLPETLTKYAHVAMTAKGWILWLIVVGICAFIAYRRGAKRIVVFAATASLLGVMMAARAPEFRYLLPIALCAVLIVAVTRWRPIVLCLLAGLLLAKAIAGDLRNHARRIETQVALREAVERVLPPRGIVVYSWRFPTPSFALRINARTAAQRAAIATRYPREGHYNDWTRTVYPERWDVLVIDEALLTEFPQPYGRTIARVGQFRIVLPPD